MMVLVGVLIAVNALAQTTVPGGDVSGIWIAAGSPYIVVGNITVLSVDSLVIEPGVEIRFEESVGLTVQGRLIADGTVSPGIGDTIRFTSNLPDPQPGDWAGVVWGGTTCDPTYCAFEYGESIHITANTTVFTDCRLSFDFAGTPDDLVMIRCLVTPDLAFYGGPMYFEDCVFNGYLHFEDGSGGPYTVIGCEISGDLRLMKYGATYTVSYTSVGGDVPITIEGTSYFTGCDIQGQITGGDVTHIDSCYVGGGIEWQQYFESGRVDLTNSTLGGQTYIGDWIYCDMIGNVIDGDVQMDDCWSMVFQDNEIHGSLSGDVSSMGPYDLEIIDNRFTDGGIDVYFQVNGAIRGNTIYNSPAAGIAVSFTYSLLSPIIENNTVEASAANGIDITGPGSGSPTCTIRNNIISSSGGYGIAMAGAFVDPMPPFNDTWNNASGNYYGCTPGVGNLSVDPLFVDPENGDYHLQSVVGSYHGGAWLPDPNHSPCIDAGDPASSYANEPLPNGDRINMGAYGNTAEASKSRTEVSGNVSGVWTASNSPYNVVGEITVASEDTLIVEPGVDVIFQGHYKLIVNGWILAEGTEEDSIQFTAANTGEGWHGIRFINAQDSSHLSYCIVEYGRANGIQGTIESWGGGILCDLSNPVISHSTFRNNWAGYRGGAIACWGGSNLTISYCSISENYASNNGGALYLVGELPNITYISYCTINDNISDCEGGGITCSQNLLIEKCIVVNNTATTGGGGIRYTFEGNLIIKNCTIYGNTASTGGGVLCNLGGNPIITNSILWENSPNQIGGTPQDVNYSCISGGWLGTGNIEEDPLFVDPTNGDYHLQSNEGSYHGGAWLPDLGHSPCIDAGDPASPHGNEPLPNGDRVNMGAYGNTAEASLSYEYNYPDVTVDLTYLTGSPVGIGGGNLYFEILIENQDSVALDYDAWLDISYEGGTPFTAVLRSFTNYLPGWAVNREDMWYPIDPGYPAGNYMMIGKVGEHPFLAWNASGFPFVKEGTDHAAGFIPYHPDVEFPNPFDEISKGEGLAGRGDLAPTEFALLGAYPNPFNPTTTISFALPEAARVRLDVFDINGRNVGVAPCGYPEGEHRGSLLQPGTHAITFDGSHLSSGIYIYRLQAGDYRASGKMALIK